MRHLVTCTLAVALLALCLHAGEKPMGNVLTGTVKSIDGKDVNLADYQGKVVLVVNVASKCGFTRQYTNLQAVYEKFKDKGLVVLGFPCNQFGGQEPGSEEEIQQFCSSEYSVTFPLFAKVDVNGAKTAPFFKALKESKPGDIGWNFEKFLINKKGEVIGRYKSGVKPDAGELLTTIEAELRK